MHIHDDKLWVIDSGLLELDTINWDVSITYISNAELYFESLFSLRRGKEALLLNNFRCFL